MAKGSVFARGRGSVMRLVWFLMLCMMCQVNPGLTEVVNRINYGVIFNPVQEVYAVGDYWLHSYQVPLPHLSPTQYFPVVCNDQHGGDTEVGDSVLCDFYITALNTINDLKERYADISNHTMTQLIQALPNTTSQIPDSRSKRKLFGFIGDLSHTLFGTATEKEVKLVASHVEALETKNQAMASTLANMSHDLSSFMQLSSSRMNNLRDYVIQEDAVIRSQADLLGRFIDDESYREMFNVRMVKELYYMVTFQAALSEFLLGVDDLLQHKLSMHLVPFSEVQATINDINEKLRLKRTALTAMSLNSKDIYGSIPFLWSYQNNSLFITIKFPLVTEFSQMLVYKVHYFPIPLNSSTGHATQIAEDKPYFAMSKQNGHYAFPSDSMMTNLKSKFLDVQRLHFPLYKLQKQSCLSELYLNNKKEVKRLCEFRVHLDMLTSSVIHIDHGQFLVINVSEVMLHCPNGIFPMTGCNFCVHEVPCLCALSTNDVYFPPRTTHCKETQTASISHPVNLAFLQQFYSESMLEHIEPDSLYERLPLVPTPHIELFTHNWTKIVADDNKVDLSLRRIAQAVTKKQQVFSQLSEPILDSMKDDWITSDLFSWQYLLLFVNMALTILAVLLIIYMFVKIRALQQTLTALVMIRAVESKDSFYLIPPTTTPVAPVLPNIDITINEDKILMYAAVTLISLTFLILLLKTMTKRQSPRTNFSLEISNNIDCVIVKLFNVPNCPRFYHCQANDGFHNFSVEGSLTPRFHWNKGTLVMTHVLDQSRPSIPKSVPISIWTAYKLRRMLKGSVYAYLLNEHCGRSFQVQVCPLSCDNCALTVPAVETRHDVGGQLPEHQYV